MFKFHKLVGNRLFLLFVVFGIFVTILLFFNEVNQEMFYFPDLGLSELTKETILYAEYDLNHPDAPFVCSDFNEIVVLLDSLSDGEFIEMNKPQKIQNIELVLIVTEKSKYLFGVWGDSFRVTIDDSTHYYRYEGIGRFTVAYSHILDKYDI